MISRTSVVLSVVLLAAATIRVCGPAGSHATASVCAPSGSQRTASLPTTQRTIGPDGAASGELVLQSLYRRLYLLRQL